MCYNLIHKIWKWSNNGFTVKLIKKKLNFQKFHIFYKQSTGKSLQIMIGRWNRFHLTALYIRFKMICNIIMVITKNKITVSSFSWCQSPLTPTGRTSLNHILNKNKPLFNKVLQWKELKGHVSVCITFYLEEFYFISQFCT